MELIEEAKTVEKNLSIMIFYLDIFFLCSSNLKKQQLILNK